MFRLKSKTKRLARSRRRMNFYATKNGIEKLSNHNTLHGESILLDVDKEKAALKEMFDKILNRPNMVDRLPQDLAVDLIFNSGYLLGDLDRLIKDWEVEQNSEQAIALIEELAMTTAHILNVATFGLVQTSAIFNQDIDKIIEDSYSTLEGVGFSEFAILKSSHRNASVALALLATRYAESDVKTMSLAFKAYLKVAIEVRRALGLKNSLVHQSI